MESSSHSPARRGLGGGLAIPAQPLALTANRKLDERRQRALTRYYLASGVGGLAVGVHTTQFAIRDPKVGLFEPVLSLAKEEMDRVGREVFRIGGICGETKQAVAEAALLKTLGYDAGLLSLAALKTADDDTLLAHCRTVGATIPLIGFYLQPAVGGRVLPYAFWRRFFEIESVIAVKIAPFNRYQTLDVIRALAETGRQDIALYTGNDDAIVADLVTTYFGRRIVGGLLGHWACWTKSGVELLKICQAISDTVPAELLATGVAETDRNAAIFDAANGFRGCIAGIHYVLQQQRLLEGIWCLDENETLSPGQREEIERVRVAYPDLSKPDDDFISEHLDSWLR
ncbi:dihydrodipicolinate synthase family protein [Armatimonas sp.]|uniref:dihydrodipicolinate synthase family protein n=1 Tax=Armatimonas sp. TaxID=1872638 RepID=UPI0037537551